MQKQIGNDQDMAQSERNSIANLFPTLKSNLRGTQCGSKEDVMAASNEYLEDQEKDLYLAGIRKLKRKWTKCIALKGNYIERLSPDCPNPGNHKHLRLSTF